nr:Neurotransmitter-gated ion-channel transmembrane region domain containing protein [Haemonchus contortus]
MADIDYFWGRQRSDPRQSAVVFGNFMLPQFKQTCYHVNYTQATTSSGSYRRLYFEILLVRNMGFYSMNIVIPSMLIVTISWVSFWLNREASPARVGLGVTTVLTMTTLITTTNNSMPKVSYIKGLDVFLNFCFVMVFASLVEYAVVSYMNKRIALRREKRRRQAEQQQRNEVPMFSNPVTPKQPNNNVYEMAMISQNSTPAKTFVPHSQLMEIPVDCDCRTIPLIQHPRLVADGTHTMWPAPFGKPKKASKTCRNVTPAKIDKCSRYLFPLLFSAFNVVYWTIMTVLSSIAEDLNGYSTAAIEYHWCGAANPNCETAVVADDVELPSYRFAKVCIDRTMATTASGSYSRLLLLFIFDRESGFYMLQIFVPAALVVVISWVSFWISRDSAPSRTIIGVMTVLTETHLMTGTNRRLPPVAYVKAVDVYLGFCYLLVVLALIEYACVAYSKKKNDDRRRREKKSEHKPTPPTPDLLNDARLAECTCNAAPTSIIAVIKQPNRFCIRHSHIDIASRVVFPCTFLFFNMLFWVVLLAKAKRLPYFSTAAVPRC